MIHQSSLEPGRLRVLVDALTYKDGWTFDFHSELDRGQGSVGATLVITISTWDSYAPYKARSVAHFMPIPPAAFDERSWRRWLLDQILLVEQHEACEFFTIDGTKPYAPHHGPGNNPYTIFEHGTDADVRTSFLGEVKP